MAVTCVTPVVTGTDEHLPAAQDSIVTTVVASTSLVETMVDVGIVVFPAVEVT